MEPKVIGSCRAGPASVAPPFREFPERTGAVLFVLDLGQAEKPLALTQKPRSPYPNPVAQLPRSDGAT